MKTRVGIIGATGYTGIELVRILQQHPEVEITAVITKSNKGMPIVKIYPHLKTYIDLEMETFDTTLIAEKCDVVFLALPHGESAPIAQTLILLGKKVIDLSSDFRLRNAENKAVYGLPEIGYRAEIQQTQLIANPGCYPTASLLAAMPALKAGIVDPNDCIFDAKSGVSGSGRGANLSNHFCEITENFFPYKLVGQHRHTPEIEQELSVIAQQPIVVQFTPQLVPMIRGLLVTAYFKLNTSISQTNVHQLYQTFYAKEPFIRLCDSDEIPQTKYVRGSNYCDIGVYVDTRTQRLLVVSAIDNLIKGAVGQAIQNLNIMIGVPETAGLLNSAIYP